MVRKGERNPASGYLPRGYLTKPVALNYDSELIQRRLLTAGSRGLQAPGDDSTNEDLLMTYQFRWLITLFASILWASVALGAEEDADVNEASDDAQEEKTIAELIEGDTEFAGLFTFYRDTDTGKTTLLLKPAQLQKEYIYFVHVADGVVDAGSFRGAYGPRFVFTIERRFDKVAIVRENTAFYFDPDNAISRASEANITRAVLAVQPILAENEETGELLIDTDSLFLSEAFTRLTPTSDPGATELPAEYGYRSRVCFL
jgi:hypothetical protein